MSSNIKLFGVTAFVIVDVLLLAWLFTRDSAPDTAGEPSASETNQEKERAPVDESVSLTRSGPLTLLRVHRSDCSGETTPKLEISIDAAQQFREVALPVDDDGELAIRSVLAVGASSSERLTLLGTNSDCDKRGYSSADGGESWRRADVSFDWYIAPDGKSITSPDRTSSPGCVPISLTFTNEETAKVVCKSGSLTGTTDGGETWAELGEVPDMRAASFIGQNKGVAIAATKECKSQAFRTEDAGESWTSVACIDEKAEARALTGGAKQMFATDGSRVWISEDLGDAWS